MELLESRDFRKDLEKSADGIVESLDRLEGQNMIG
jgi:hypothetical protein